MIPSSLGLAKRFYRATPWRWLRRFAFDAFLRVNRGRRRVVTREGLTFDLDLGEIIDVGLYLQEYERDLAAVIDELCQPGWTALDVGANVGAHTLRLGSRVGSEGRVCAFEPMDFAYDKLVRNLSLNPLLRIEAYRVALSDRNERDGALSARSSWRSDGVRTASPASRVDFLRLDDWCREHGIDRVDLIKVDVDGAEFQVLSGGRDTINRNHPLLLMEVGAWHFQDATSNPIRLLQELGYRFWDTLTKKEYVNVEAIRQRLPEKDDAMAVSLNILCSARIPW